MARSWQELFESHDGPAEAAGDETQEEPERKQGFFKRLFGGR